MKFEIIYPHLCKYCERELINEKMRTKNGCIWCDSRAHDKKKKKSSKA